MIYGVNNSIFSLRELEYKIKQDIVFQKIIGLKEVPDHSTFSLRAIALEKYVYYGIYAMLIELIIHLLYLPMLLMMMLNGLKFLKL
ncbi:MULTISPECIES: transposase [Clostridium]|nr:MULTISPECIES: transposase [Clostridium]KEI11200.1 hypothetical protein Z958_10715 [Clostridium novyi B str. NCTC 9691]OOB74901.1 hypothetical protein AXF41_14900 [Clostridium haemolyticum]